jgi:hypothetical protein
VREQARALLGGDIAFTTRLPNYPRPICLALDSLYREGVGFRAGVDVRLDGARAAHRGSRRPRFRAVTPGYPFYGRDHHVAAG